MSDVRRNAGLSLWRQIAEAIGADIGAGVWRAGDRLPTETELAARFAVNRHTLRRAMGELEHRGVVRIEQGRGTFVAEDVIDYPVGRRTRFTEILAGQQRLAGGRVLRAIEVPADQSVAQALRIRRGQPVVLVERIGEADGRPVGFTTHHFPKIRVPGLIESLEGARSITRALRAAGIEDYTRATTRVAARMPTADEARLLQQRSAEPILVAEAVNVDTRGRPIEFGVTRFAAVRVKLVFGTGT